MFERRAGEQMFRSPYNTGSSKNNNEIKSEVCSIQLEPTTLEEALEGEGSQMWNLAIRDEINPLYENNTWILQRKYKSDCNIDKYKARLVVRGCSKKRGVDYDEIYTLVVKYESVRLLLSIAAAFDTIIYQFDVKIAFLHGKFGDVIYVEQPYGYGQDKRVCKLPKWFYGLKQAFIQSSADLYVFYYNSEQIITYLALYVDDGLLCGNNVSFIVDLLKTLNNEFNITYGIAESFVGIQIEVCGKKKMKLKIHQQAYVKRVLKRFNHANCAAVSIPAEPGMKFSKLDTKSEEKFPYQEAIGSLIYLMISTRPDVAFSVGVLSRYNENPSQIYCNGVKRIFKYLKGTDDRGLSYNIGPKYITLKMYCDADWVGDLVSRRSTTGWIATINDGPIA